MAYAFPTNLLNEDIQQCLADLQINLDPSQLSKPTYDAVRIYYEQAVIALMNISREELNQPIFSALSSLEYPDLHEESIPAINFYQKLIKLMVVCGVRDFNLNDLFKPDAHRLKRNLCALINFAKFRDEKLGMLDELEAVMSKKVAREQALLADQENMMAEIRRLKEARASRQQEAVAIEAEAAAIASTNIQLNKVHATLSEEIRVIKVQTNALTDQASEAKLTLNSLHNEAQELQDQIVQSPEKHQGAVNDLIFASEKKRDYYAFLCSVYHDNERKLEMLAKFERELQRCIKLLEELEVAVARKKDASADTKDTKEAIGEEERRFNELVSINTTSKRQVAALQDKLSRIEQQSQLKFDAAASLLEDAIRRREAAEAEHAAGGARAAEQEAQTRQWRERAEGLRSTHDARVKAIVDKYSTLRRAVGEYNRRMEVAISANMSPDVMAGLDLGSDLLLGRDTTSAQRGKSSLLSGMQQLTLM